MEQCATKVSQMFDVDPAAETLRPLDRVAVAMEAKWGLNRLPALVSPDLARRFALARQDLDRAIEANDLEAVAHYAAALQRGWQVLDQAATAAGHQPEDPGRVWHLRHGELHFVLVQDNEDAKAARMAWPQACIWTMAEIGRVLAARQLTAVIDAKRELGAELKDIRRKPPPDWARGDPLPASFRGELELEEGRDA